MIARRSIQHECQCNVRINVLSYIESSVSSVVCESLANRLPERHETQHRNSPGRNSDRCVRTELLPSTSPDWISSPKSTTKQCRSAFTTSLAYDISRYAALPKHAMFPDRSKCRSLNRRRKLGGFLAAFRKRLRNLHGLD